MSPFFYIRDFINANSDLTVLRNELYKNNILSKDYVEENLFLIYNKYENSTSSNLDRECRSIIIDRNTKEIISYSCESPLLNSKALDYLLTNQQEEKVITKCYEGTLLSVFNHNNKWYVSTRRCLDSSESVWGDKSHFSMFMDVLNESGYEMFTDFTQKLDSSLCYYFVLLHHQNKNIVDYAVEFGKEYKRLSLLFVRDKVTQEEINIYDNNEFDNILDDNIFLPEKIDTLDEFDNMNKDNHFVLPPKTEGIVIKIYDSKMNRYRLLKFQTINYQFAKSTGSEKNIYMGLIHLYQNDTLFDYINQVDNLKRISNPLNLSESFDMISAIDSLFKVMTSEIFELFKILWDIKTGKQLNNLLYKNLPKEYKDVLFAIKGIYYKKKTLYSTENIKAHYLQIKDIYQYFKTMSVDTFCGLLKARKLMFNWTKYNKEIGDFLKISFKCDKMYYKLIAIYTNKLFPNLTSEDVPVVYKKQELLL